MAEFFYFFFNDFFVQSIGHFPIGAGHLLLVQFKITIPGYRQNTRWIV